MRARQIGPLNLGAGDTSPKFFDISYVHNNAAMNPYRSKRTKFLMEFLKSFLLSRLDACQNSIVRC